jgi:hypothetical protein
MMSKLLIATTSAVGIMTTDAMAQSSGPHWDCRQGSARSFACRAVGLERYPRTGSVRANAFRNRGSSSTIAIQPKASVIK